MTDKPDLTRVWAAGAPSGNIVDPDTSTPGKFAAGWQAEVPPFEHFNFIQKLQTQGLAHINEQGIAVWDSYTTYPVGGLAKGSDGNVYKALASQSGNNPVADDGTNWKVFGEDGNLTYIIGTSYTIGDLVTTGTAVYRSITSDNINNNPDTDDGTNWDRVLTFSEVGSSIGNLVQLGSVGGSPGLPAVDGSQLTGLQTVKGERPAITFIMDDLWESQLALATAFESRGVFFGLAANNNLDTTNKITTAEALDLESRGFEFIAHGATHLNMTDSSAVTYPQAKTEIEDNLTYLQGKGLTPKGFVAPNSQLKREFMPIVRNLVDFSYTVSKGFMTQTQDTPVVQHHMSRVSMFSNSAVAMKAIIDTAITENSLVSFYDHDPSRVYKL